jgi:hypothetical protein
LNKQFQGRPVEVRYAANLRDMAGNAADAATYIRDRVIILDQDLAGDEHQRVLCHELFHFVWVRLGNPRRLAWETLLAAEWHSGARGETGWSSEWRKQKLSAEDVTGRTRRWREYCCESFCDTAAWLFASNKSELTLSPKWREGRKTWFARHIGSEETRSGISI